MKPLPSIIQKNPGLTALGRLLKARGFTILELLVAVAVLVLLVLMVAQLVQSGSAVIAGSRKSLDADAQAREVFGRMAMDLAQMPKRADLDAIFSGQPGNKKMFFYSEAPGFSSSANQLGTLSLIGYRIGTNATESGFQRLGKGLDWAGADSAIFLTYANATNAATVQPGSTIPGAWPGAVGAAPDYDGIDSDYHTLAPGVFRFEYCFQKKDGTYSLSRDPTNGFRDVSAIVVSLAVLDGESKKIAPDTSKLAAALPGPTAANLAANVMPGELWQNTVNDSAAFATSAGIPQSAAARVRIYQRAFPLNTP